MAKALERATAFKGLKALSVPSVETDGNEKMAQPDLFPRRHMKILLSLSMPVPKRAKALERATAISA